jgi:hypothetical protein
MDGGKISSISIAVDKAFTAATARKPTHVYNQLCQSGQPTFGIHITNGGHFSIIGGGMPVTVNGEIVGGIGISSGTAGEDVEVAEAALAVFLCRDGSDRMIGKTILYSEMRPAPEWEDRFNTWYHEDHIPVRMVLEGWEGAQRYTADEDEDYLVIYDLTSTDALKTPEYETLKNDPSDETKWMLANVSNFTRFIGAGAWPRGRSGGRDHRAAGLREPFRRARGGRGGVRPVDDRGPRAAPDGMR